MPLTRRQFISAAPMAVAAISGESTMAFSSRPARPCFVVIYCDDLGYGDLGCYGSPHIRTPHLDALAATGVRFTDWYSNSPVCSPSRAALLTGRYPQRNGVTEILGGGRGTPGLRPSERTIAAVLKEHGYRTALYGKWHLGLVEECRPNAHGFDEFRGFLAGCVDYYSHIFYWGQGGGHNPTHDLWHNREEVWDNGHYLTEAITEHAVSFIEQKSEDPFFLYVAYNAPHYPMHAPQKYMDRYPDLPWDRRVMAAMVSAVDDGVGRIVEALRRTGRFENTTVFFSSDNGPSDESRNWLDGTEDAYYGGSAGIFRGHKGSLFEGGIREPAILCSPARLPHGRVCSEVGAMMDVFPTVLDVAGIAPPAGLALDGVSALSMAAGKARSPHERVFWAYNGQTAVREGRWKLVLNGKLDFSRTQPDAVHLSDLAADPGERTNLAEREPEVVARLTQAIRAWEKSVR